MKKKIYSIALSGLLLASSGLLKASNPDTTAENSNNSALKLTELNNSQGSEDGVKGKIIISAGVGLNGGRTAMVSRYITHDAEVNGTPTISSSSQIPMINLGVDYGFAKRFSIGGAVGYQSIVLNADAANNGIAGTDTWTRLNFAARVDYYIVASSHAILYTGIKGCYNAYSLKSTYSSIDPDYVSKINAVVHPLTGGGQIHMGFSYFFNETVGFNTEAGLAVGGPYFFSFGLGVKI